jgi:hypothetical protein
MKFQKLPLPALLFLFMVTPLVLSAVEPLVEMPKEVPLPPDDSKNPWLLSLDAKYEVNFRHSNRWDVGVRRSFIGATLQKGDAFTTLENLRPDSRSDSSLTLRTEISEVPHLWESYFRDDFTNATNFGVKNFRDDPDPAIRKQVTAAVNADPRSAFLSEAEKNALIQDLYRSEVRKGSGAKGRENREEFEDRLDYVQSVLAFQRLSLRAMWEAGPGEVFSIEVGRFHPVAGSKEDRYSDTLIERKTVGASRVENMNATLSNLAIDAGFTKAMSNDLTLDAKVIITHDSPVFIDNRDFMGQVVSNMNEDELEDFKRWYQLNTFIARFGASFANKIETYAAISDNNGDFGLQGGATIYADEKNTFVINAGISNRDYLKSGLEGYYIYDLESGVAFYIKGGMMNDSVEPIINAEPLDYLFGGVGLNLNIKAGEIWGHHIVGVMGVEYEYRNYDGEREDDGGMVAGKVGIVFRR